MREQRTESQLRQQFGDVPVLRQRRENPDLLVLETSRIGFASLMGLINENHVLAPDDPAKRLALAVDETDPEHAQLVAAFVPNNVQCMVSTCSALARKKLTSVLAKGCAVELLLCEKDATLIILANSDVPDPDAPCLICGETGPHNHEEA